jgi:chromosome segregation ATPase
MSGDHLRDADPAPCQFRIAQERIAELEAEIKRKDRARRSLLVMFEKLREEHERPRNDLAYLEAVIERKNERIAELEQANEIWRKDFAKLKAEKERLRELLGKAYERLQYLEMDCTQLEDEILAALQEGE